MSSTLKSMAMGAIVSTLVASNALADGIVHQCRLNNDADLTNAEIRVFEFDGFIHSAYLQFTTDYGDTLPYLFMCDVNCKMQFAEDEYEYLLVFARPLTNGAQVELRTASNTNDFKSNDDFEAYDCGISAIETD